MHAAGAVSAVVKSGTNQIHGDVFEFLRNGDFNARNAFAATRDSLKRNQYGGTLGGPIIKDELPVRRVSGTQARSRSSRSHRLRPHGADAARGFLACSTFPANIIDFTTGAPFPEDQVRRGALQSAGAQDRGSAAEGHRSVRQHDIRSGAESTRTRVWLAAVPGELAANDFCPLYGDHLLPPAYEFSKNLLDTGTGGLDDIAHAAALGDTYLFSPTTVNAFRISVNRVSVYRFNDDYFSGCDIGVNLFCFVPHQTVVTVTGGPRSASAPPSMRASFRRMSRFPMTCIWCAARIRSPWAFGQFKYQHSQIANVFSAGFVQFRQSGRRIEWGHGRGHG